MSLSSIELPPVFGLLSGIEDWLRGFARWGLGLSAAECIEHLDTVGDVRRKAAAGDNTRMS
ncbi:MAG: hypothetical protein Q8M37_03785 [Nevskia sp.]|nr:hypothetical protein [Nevskia sp.]